ncbi:helix-turn-helix transcriptional regulator [Rhodopseudomonas telluris]|uniref:LuxR C-terminal-related transcriptional regulator n=1 Tax=Rhodopseudomonas telluris TaxID=644215 RepID=A0ABV6EVM0_9BRAD
MRNRFDLDSARRLSAALLKIYALSRSTDVGRFQQAALQRLADDLPFRAAWWGMVRAQPGGGFALHSSFRFALPEHFVTTWEAVALDDDVARVVTARPGATGRFSRDDLGRTRGLALMSERYDIGSMLSTVIADRRLGIATFLSLYRPVTAPSFGEAERGFKELLMPHLTAAWHANWLQHFDGLRSAGDHRGGGLALADRHGLLHIADDGFAELIRREWSGWNGPALPPALRASAGGESAFQGRRLRVASSREGDLIVLRARSRTPLDVLSPREAEIAACYALGQSYKDIAARLACSPYTVRHHLRGIYDKLGVSNKAALARIAGGAAQPPAGGTSDR